MEDIIKRLLVVEMKIESLSDHNNDVQNLKDRLLTVETTTGRIDGHYKDIQKSIKDLLEISTSSLNILNGTSVEGSGLISQFQLIKIELKEIKKQIEEEEKTRTKIIIANKILAIMGTTALVGLIGIAIKNIFN